MASRRRMVTILLAFLALFLLGTVVVLSTISFYLRIDPPALITEFELEGLSSNSTDRSLERVPRIIHQTWKTESLPDQWRNVSLGCRDLMPDYEYMLWTDALSREFISTRYPWFLPTFDAYPYPIQRADAIRYFVLHHYGGVYLDLDVGCLRPLDSLLVFPVILPKTIPVGVSNDLMFAEKGHAFMEQTIHNLVTFDHSYVLNYPTVMFSTGPMFLSAQFGLYTASHPPSLDHPGGDVRILPKSLYGKNAEEEGAPNSFFTHHYGSSWHADDAAFIAFLGEWGKVLMWLGLAVLIYGVGKLVLQKKLKTQHGERLRRRFVFGRYDVVLPRAYHRDGSFHIDLGFVTVSEPLGTTTEPTTPLSSFSSMPSSPIGDRPLLPISLGVRSPSPTGSSEGRAGERVSISAMAVHAFRQASTWLRSSAMGSTAIRPRTRRRGSRNRGVMFFLPAIFTPSPSTATSTTTEEHDIPLLSPQTALNMPRSRSRSPLASKMDSEDFVLSNTNLHTIDFRGARNTVASSSTGQSPPPPYEQGRSGHRTMATEWVAGDATWDEWTGDDAAH